MQPLISHRCNNLSLHGKKKPPGHFWRGGFGKEPGSALLSHGGPHYHRRWAVSLPRSGWDRVVPARHGRQAIRRGPFHRLSPGARPSAGRPCGRPAPGFARRPRPKPGARMSVQSKDSSPPSRSASKASRGPRRPLGCYMAKPHGQLVSVSCTRYRASTPDLSTWWSSRALQGVLDPREASSWEGLPA